MGVLEKRRRLLAKPALAFEQEPEEPDPSRQPRPTEAGGEAFPLARAARKAR